MSEQMSELAVLARQLGLDEVAQTVLMRLVTTQRKIDRHASELQKLQVSRRADVLFLIDPKIGVTRYRLAQLLGKSQTTLSNIANHEPEPVEDAPADADSVSVLSEPAE